MTNNSFSDLHDGYLDGLQMMPDKSLVLFCRLADGTKQTITIPKIESLRADEFRAGNIIDCINFYQGEACPEKLIEHLEGYTIHSPVEYLQNQMRRIRENDWSLMQLTSSYGCELSALFASAPAKIIRE